MICCRNWSLQRPQCGSKLMGFYFMMLKPRKFCLACNNLQCIMNQMSFPQVLSNLAFIGDDFTWSTHIEHISIRLSKVNLLLMMIIIVFLKFTLGLSTALFSDNNQTWTNIIKWGNF